MGKVKDLGNEVLDKIKSLKELLLAFIFRNSINQKLEEMADQLERSIINGEIMQDDLKELSTVIDRLAGSLRNTSPEQLEQTQKECFAFIDDHINSLYEKGKIVDTKVNEPNFYSAMKSLSSKYENMSDADFKQHFNANAVLLNNGNLNTDNNAVEGKTSMLIELDGECYEAEFDVTEPDIATRKRSLTISVDKYNGSYADAQEIPQVKDGDKYETMMRSFLFPRELRRESDIRKFDIKKLMKENQAVYDFVTIEKYKDKVVESADGRTESTYDSKTNQFRIRDKENGNMIIIKNDRNNVVMDFAADTTGLLDKDLAQKLAADDFKSYWEYDKAKGQIVYQLHFLDERYSNLFNSKEMFEILNTKGVKKNEFLNSIERKNEHKTFNFSKTDVEQLDKIDNLSDALSRVVKHYNDTENRYVINDSRRFKTNKATQKKDGGVHLSVYDKKSNYRFSFTFDEKGEPRCLNYRKEVKDLPEGKFQPRFKFAYNFLSFNHGKDFYKTKSDPDYLAMLQIMKQARTLYIDNQKDIEKAKGVSSAENKINSAENKYSDNVNVDFKEVSAEPTSFIHNATMNDFDKQLRKAHGNNAKHYCINKLYNDVKTECGNVISGKVPNINLNVYSNDFLLDIAKAMDFAGNPSEKLNAFIADNPLKAAEKIEKALVDNLPTRTDRGAYNRGKEQYELSVKNLVLDDTKQPEAITGSYKVQSDSSDAYRAVLQDIADKNKDEVSAAYVARLLTVDVTQAREVITELTNAGVLEEGGFVNEKGLKTAYEKEFNENKTDIDDKE